MLALHDLGANAFVREYLEKETMRYLDVDDVGLLDSAIKCTDTSSHLGKHASGDDAGFY